MERSSLPGIHSMPAMESALFIQIHADNQIDRDSERDSRLEDQIRQRLARFEGRITDVEVHVSDVNGPRGGNADLRCSIEARVNGIAPVAAIDQAPRRPGGIGSAKKLFERSTTSAAADDRSRPLTHRPRLRRDCAPPGSVLNTVNAYGRKASGLGANEERALCIVTDERDALPPFRPPLRGRPDKSTATSSACAQPARPAHSSLRALPPCESCHCRIDTDPRASTMIAAPAPMRSDRAPTPAPPSGRSGPSRLDADVMRCKADPFGSPRDATRADDRGA